MSWTEATDPWALFDRWYADAVASEPDVPEAMQLATADETGQPSVRTVLLKGVSPDGLQFFSNLGSRKGLELEKNAKAAVAFHWKTLKRQVVARGPVRRLSDAEADAYWATRPRGSQLAAWASKQSQTLPDPSVYDAAVAEATAHFERGDVPRPEIWSGWRLLPAAIEFWQDGAYRMHTRVVFERTDVDADAWSKRMLFP